jgi:hypothetical protein
MGRESPAGGHTHMGKGEQSDRGINGKTPPERPSKITPFFPLWTQGPQSAP